MQKHLLQTDFSDIGIILVDDNKNYTDAVTALSTQKGEKIFAFNNAPSVMQYLSFISKQVKFYLDHDLGWGMNGSELARILYNKGYRELYMASGSATDLSVPYIKGYFDKLEII